MAQLCEVMAGRTTVATAVVAARHQMKIPVKLRLAATSIPGVLRTSAMTVVTAGRCYVSCGMAAPMSAMHSAS